MQILASALPGFRDLRAPLIAGHMWLLFLYLLARPDVTSRPSNDLAGAAYDLGSAVGGLWVAAAIGLAAYLIGAISLAMTEWLLPLADLFPFWVKYTGAVASSGIREQRERLTEGRLEQLGEDTASALGDTIDRRFNAAARQLAAEANMPATLLVGDKPHLFAEVDRLRSEGDLRIAASPPLMSLLILVAIESSPLWALATVGVFILAVQGMNRRTESRQVILDAIEREVVASSTLQRLTTWVDDLLRLGDMESSERQEAMRRFVVRN